jgi:parallel beta-helix repeat protein
MWDNMKTVCVMLIVFLLVGMLTFSSSLQPVRAAEVMAIEYIYIRENGTVDPPEAPISTGDQVTYFLSDNIANRSLVIERDNITFNGGGWTISGTEELNSIGVNVTGRHNVTILNTNIEKFEMGVHVVYSSMIRLEGNNVSNNRILYWMDFPLPEYFWTGIGISVSRSNKTDILSNTASNNIFGIYVYESNDTNVMDNNASSNNQHEDTTYYGTGISVYDSKNITVADNMVSNNGVMGINLASGTVDYPCFNNTVRNNTITGHAFGAYSYGLYVSWSRDNVIAENSICSNIYGVNIRYFSQSQTIKNNNISSNSWGIYCDESTNNTISNNTFLKNAEGIRFENCSNNKILQNNILNSSSFGIYIRSYSSNNLVLGNNVSYSFNGVMFTESSNNHVFWNRLSSSNNSLVIYYYSSNNEVADNDISSNDKGITITYGSYNTKVFHNNFIGNAEHVYTDMNSTWDNSYPCGGNYWSNYTGSDLYSGTLQDETGSDGIGDAPHAVNMNNTDQFPLMAPITVFEVGTWEDLTRYVDVISNSTISNFEVNVGEKTVNFNVTGETGAGFCRVIIPNIIVETLWNGNYTVTVNGAPVEFRNWTDTENKYIYFTYPHSTHEIVIIPEFPITALVAFLIITATLVIAFKKRKQPQPMNSK